MIPLLNLLDAIFGRKLKCKCLEDNEAVLAIVEKGYSSSLRHIGRVHGCSMGFLHTCFMKPPLSEQLELNYCNTNEMAADALTKHIVEADKWAAALVMLGMTKS